MSSSEVTVVRIYLHEGEAQLDNLMKRLHDWEHVRGLTVFRGIAGFGDSGQLLSSKLIDLSLDLPLVVELFDTPEKVEAVIDHLGDTIKAGHMLSWRAQINSNEEE